ncbi:MAG TPA: hypothetical protein VMK82_04130 [Steroidobacteraceae bacterium]|nr:hypothetical protein [Steroidobacteraceae bacterium]
MTPLIAMPGPWLPDDAADARALGAIPELPALTRLLRRARRLQDAEDWRAGVLAALGAGSGVSPVSVAAQAVPVLAQDATLCFAAPLHVVAGMSRVHLQPGGRLLLDSPEDQAWCDAFNQEFGSSGLRLHVASPGGGWLLSAPFAHSARDPAPQILVGTALERQPAASEEERSLRRLGAEVEMWLSGHALNRVREARRQPPINALWFWDGARADALPAMRVPRGIVDGSGLPDAWLAGLARHFAVPAAIGRDWHHAMRAVEATAGAGPLLIVLAPDSGGATGQYWQMLEDHWFAPAARALAEGGITGLRLQIGPGAFALPNRSLSAWLRWRRRSWWQLCGQVRP